MPTSSRPVNLHSENFEFEASVIIPVRNRAHTIRDAVNSALNQRTTFSFNIIVIDNHSTDGTTEILQELSSDKRLIHIIPQENDLGIGGCWNKGICHEKCGKFAIQLDSDDLYKDESTLQKIVDTFYKESCAMVIGTYLMTDFQLNEIPPVSLTTKSGHRKMERTTLYVSMVWVLHELSTLLFFVISNCRTPAMVKITP